MTLRTLFLQHLAPTSEFPLMLEIERTEGVYLFGTNGEKWIDFISGIGVSSLGHRHPAVQKAVEEQLNRYWHTMVYGEYVLSPQVKLATKLSEVLPQNLNSVYFTNSGAEATEGAMKLAKRFTGRYEIIACKDAYHGSTQGAASLMSDGYFTDAYRPLLPGIKHIEFNKIADLQHITDKTAAIFVEPIKAESGVTLPENDYLLHLQKRCHQTGTLLILDEIQTGYGRTGTLFAFEQWGIIPDILLLAKGMGGGMPIGAFVASKDIMKVLSVNPLLGHITTFGGHPVSCAAALATLEALLQSNYISQVSEKAHYIKASLQHPKVREIRHSGLLMAVELSDFDCLQRVIQYSLKNGVITDWFLFNNRSMRIAPPLTITYQEIDAACAVIRKGLDLL